MPYIVTIERANATKSAGVTRFSLKQAMSYAGTLSFRALCPLFQHDSGMDAVKIHIDFADTTWNDWDEDQGPECFISSRQSIKKVCTIPVINGCVRVEAAR
jgi:hypothetical protein